MSKWSEYIRAVAEEEGILAPSREKFERVDTADGVASFSDGDSGAVTAQGVRTEFRLAGIDAPEVGHPDRETGVPLAAEAGGYDARAYLAELLQKNPGTKRVSTGEKDYYGRGDISELITPDGTNLNVEMVRSGMVSRSGDAGREYREASIGATLNTMTEAGDSLTGDARIANETVRRVHAEAEAALNSGEITNAAAGGMLEGYNRVNDHGTAKNAWNRGMYNTAAMVGGLEAAVGDAFGVDGMRADGLESAAKNQTLAGVFPAKVSKWDDVNNVSDAATYALEKTVENLPIIGVTAAGALATGGSSLVGQSALTTAGLRTAAGAVARVGMKHGAMGTLYGINAGDSALQLHAEGADDFGATALTVAVPKTMLDYASLAAMTKGVAGAVKSATKGKGFDPVEAAGTFIANVTREGATEGAQQMLDNSAIAFKTGNDFNFDNVKESMIAGAVVGGAFAGAQALPGAAVSTVNGIKGIVTSREPKKDIEAQLQAQAEGAKPSTFVSDANSDSYDAQVAAAGEGATVMRSPEGQLATQQPVPDDVRDMYENGTPEQRNTINAAYLNYTEDKTAIDPATAGVVQVTRPDGAVVHEEVTNNPEAVKAKLEQSKRPDDAVVVTDAVQAQLRRVEAMGLELSEKTVEAYNRVQELVAQDAPIAEVNAAEGVYRAVAAELEQAQQLQEQLSGATLDSPQTNEGAVNERGHDTVDNTGTVSDVQQSGSTGENPRGLPGRLLPENVQPSELSGAEVSGDAGGAKLGTGVGGVTESAEAVPLDGVRPVRGAVAPAEGVGTPAHSGREVTANPTGGEINDQSTRPADDAGRNVPDAGAERAGGDTGPTDNGAGSVDSGAPENASVAGDRAKGPRVDIRRLDEPSRRSLGERIVRDKDFAKRVATYMLQGHDRDTSLGFVLADEKIAAEDIPIEYTPSADNTLFDESELPSSDDVMSPEDVDAPENIENFATGEYYGALLTLHQEAFHARHPTWQLEPVRASRKTFHLVPRARVSASKAEAEAEATRLEPVYYGYAFKTVAHDGGGFTLTRHKVNAALSTDAMHPTRSWVYQALPKIKLNARGAVNAIAAAMNRAKNLRAGDAKRQLEESIVSNQDKLLQFKQPDGTYIELHTPTLVEQGMSLLGQYGSYTTTPEYKFLALKQAMSALATTGIVYEPRQGPGIDFFPQETIIGFTEKGGVIRIADVTKAQAAATQAEVALGHATAQLYKLEGELSNVRDSAKNAGIRLSSRPSDQVDGVARRIKTRNIYQSKADDLSAQIAKLKLTVSELQARVADYNGANTSGKNPYAVDEMARTGVFDAPDVAHGRAEVDVFAENMNAAMDKTARTEAQGFSGSADGFYKPENKGTSETETTPDFADIAPSAEVKSTVSAFLRKYPGARTASVKYRIGAGGEKAKYSPVSDTLYIYTNNITDAADLSRSLRHELLVHKGLGLFDTKRITEVFDQLKSAIARNAELKDAFATIQNDRYYSKLPEREQLEELLAFVAEGIDSGLVEQTFNRLVIALRTLLKNLGLIDKTNVNFAEVEAIVHDIANAYRTGLRRSLRGDQQAKFWRTITGMDGVFTYGKSSAKSLEDITTDLEGAGGYTAYADEALPMQSEFGATKGWRIDMPEGGQTTVFQVGNRVWIDIHESQMGTGGSRVYNIVANYAYNNGKVFIGDPAGISPEAMSRRLENMLSSALKFGTTNHLAPHPDQLKGGSGVPALNWVAGDTWGNIAAMLEASYASTRSQIPEVDNYQYDPVTDTITHRDSKKVLSDDDIRELAVRARREPELAGRHNAGGAGDVGSPITAGRSSITRAILGGTFLRSQGSERSELLAALGNVQSQRLQDAFYRLDSAAIQLKFHELRRSRVGKWGASLRAAGASFTNLVYTGYTQMRQLHPATAERFKNYQAHKNQMSAYWLSVWHNNIGLSTERTKAAFAELLALGENANIRKEQVSADAWAVRKYLDEIRSSTLKKYSPTLGKIPNYLPQPVDTRAMISDKEAFIEILLRHPMDGRNPNAKPMTREEAEGVFDALLGNSGLDGLTVEELEGAVGVGNKHRHQRTLRNPALIQELDAAGFMFDDKREAMEYYITQGVNRAAFERVFGGYRPVVALLDRNGAINESLLKSKLAQAGHVELTQEGLRPDVLLQRAMDMGYAKMVDSHVHWYSPVSRLHDAREQVRTTGEDGVANLRKFDDLSHGMLGFFGDRIGSETKLWQSRIMAGQSLLTLAFSAFSSQTDWAGPTMRVMQDKGVREAWSQLQAGIRSMSNAKEARAFATAFGFIVPRQHQSVIRSMAGADHMSAGSQKALDVLFKYNGQAWFTDMTRTFAASTGIHYFKTLAADKDALLQSYGLDVEQVNRWIEAGEKAPTQSMERADKAAFDDAMAVHAALHKFVNESIMRPDSTQRPNWANDPRFALLWHLKSFFWAFWATIMQPTFRSAFTQMKTGNYAEGSAQLAFTGLLLLPLAAVGWEARQLIQYSLFGADQPSDYMDGMDYTLELASRAGIFGPAQLAFDALGTEDSGRAVARLAGPAADHLYTLLHAETDEKIYRSIPILSQLYGAQDAISD